MPSHGVSVPLGSTGGPKARGFFACLILIHAFSAACPLVARTASAQDLPNLAVAVTRGPGAEDCPSSEELENALAREHQVSTPGPVALDVRFDRDEQTYRAIVSVSGARAGVRSLSVADPQCAPLVEALTVAVLLLLDPEASGPADASAEASVASPPPAQPSGAQPVSSAPAPTDQGGDRVFGPQRIATASMHASDTSLQLDLVPRVVAGLAPAVTAGAEVGFAARWNWISGRLGVSGFVPRSRDFEGGRARGWLAAAHVAACAHWQPDPAVDLAGCGLFWGGFASVTGVDYDENATSTRPLLAAGPGARLSGPFSDNWGWVLDGAPLVLVLRQRFVVTGAGEAFSVPPVGAWLGAGLWLKID